MHIPTAFRARLQSQSIRRSSRPRRKLAPRIQTALLLLPALIFLGICIGGWRWQVVQDQRIAASYIPGQPYAKYLYEQLELEELLGERGEVENYYYRFAKIRNLHAPYILLRYRKTEADRVEAFLQTQPKTLCGRVDMFYTEDYEYIKRFFQWPAIEQGYPTRIEDSLCYTFNLSDFSSDRHWRIGLLILIELGLLTFPWLYQRAVSLQQTILPDPPHNAPEEQKLSPAPADPKPPVLPTSAGLKQSGAFQPL